MLKKYLSILVFLFTYLSFAQSKEITKSEVVVSEESIQRLANKLYELKLKYNLAESPNQSALYQNSSDTTLLIINAFDNKNTRIDNLTQENPKLEEILSRLAAIEKQLDKINNQKVDKSDSKTDTIFITETQKEIEKVESQLSEDIINQLSVIQTELAKNNQVTTESEDTTSKKKSIFKKDKNKDLTLLTAMQVEQRMAIKKSNAKLDSLLQIITASKIDSLQNNQNSLQTKDSIVNPNKSDFESLKYQIYLLNAKLDKVLNERIDEVAKQKVANASATTDTIIIEKTTRVDTSEEEFEARKLKYENYFKQLFFENNSVEIKEKYNDLITSMVDLLKSDSKIDIAISGFASKTGNEAYNQKISMQRALELKNKLTQMGINSNRILTSYEGIDYEAESLAAARRLDIKLIVRK